MQSERPHPIPTNGWHEIAAGDIGDKLWWEPGYEPLRASEALIGLLWNLNWNEIDWERLLKGLPRFDFLRTLGPSRFFSFLSWGEVDGFRAVEHDNQEETGSMSGEWTSMHVEMDHGQKKDIFCDFEELCRRLEEYDPLKPFL
jgi:hypothetical protein